MAGVGQQRQAAPDDAADQLGGEDRHRQPERDRQAALALRALAVAVGMAGVPVMVV